MIIIIFYYYGYTIQDKRGLRDVPILCIDPWTGDERANNTKHNK